MLKTGLITILNYHVNTGNYMLILGELPPTKFFFWSDSQSVFLVYKSHTF
jgi:hypothetical protein